MRSPSPSQAFRKFVCDPIPKSVKEIKMDRRVELLGLVGAHRYVLHFRIDKEDLWPIVNSKQFKEVQYIEYDDESGLLRWAEEPPPNPYSEEPLSWKTVSLSLYSLRSGETDPAWFSLEQWDSPKVYVLEDRNVYRARFLVYNEQLGEAYFIDYRMPD